MSLLGHFDRDGEIRTALCEPALGSLSMSHGGGPLALPNYYCVPDGIALALIWPCFIVGGFGRFVVLLNSGFGSLRGVVGITWLINDTALTLPSRVQGVTIFARAGHNIFSRAECAPSPCFLCFPLQLALILSSSCPLPLRSHTPSLLPTGTAGLEITTTVFLAYRHWHRYWHRH